MKVRTKLKCNIRNYDEYHFCAKGLKLNLIKRIRSKNRILSFS